jgi:hypothetical protein
MLKISVFVNAEKTRSINDLAYPVGCEVSDANAVLRKHYVMIVNAGMLMLTFRSKIGGDNCQLTNSILNELSTTLSTNRVSV